MRLPFLLLAMLWVANQFRAILRTIAPSLSRQGGSGAKSTLPTVLPVENVGEGVIRVLGCNPGPYTLQGTNTYVVGKGKDRLLIDTGEGVPEYHAKLLEVLEAEGCGISDILLTHHHHDHIGGVPALRERFQNVRVWKAAPTTDEEVKAVGTTINPIHDQQVFKTEGATLRAITTPGHTTDHVTFVLEEDRSLFSGDCVLGCGSSVFENLYDYMNSLKKLLENENVTAIYPGHGPVLPEGKAAISNYISHRDAREAQVHRVLTAAAPKTVWAIVNEVYGSLPWTLFIGAYNNVQHHLAKMLREGRVRQSRTWLMQEGWVSVVKAD